MGSLATHISTFIFIFPIGLHRLYSSTSLYLKDPSHYNSKPWFFTDPIWQRFDLFTLFTLLITLPFVTITDLLIFLSFSGYPTYRFSYFSHGVLVLLFWVLLIMILMKESCDLLCLNERILFLFGGVCFLIEFWINGSGFNGVCSNVYGLHGGLTLVCGFSCLYLSIKPSGFIGDVCLSCGLIFKGTWVLQIGLNLYSASFGLKGCKEVNILVPNDQGFVDVRCDLDEDKLRGIELMKLLFVWHAIVVFVICFGVFGVLAWKEKRLRCGEGSGPLLAKIEAQSVEQLHELELE